MAWLLALALATAPAPTLAPGTYHGCPRSVQPLPAPLASSVPALRADVLAFARARVKQRGRVTDVRLVQNWLPSGWIARECGTAVWRRSVAVSVYFPALDPPHNPIGHCNSCASITFIASRTASGWTVWARY